MIRGFWVRSRPTSYAICRGAVAFVWFYQGLVPKLLGPDEDELAMNLALGFSQAGATHLATIAGWLEMVLAAIVVLFWRHRWPLSLTVVAMATLLLFVSIAQPALLSSAFNAVTTNVSVLALSLVALQLHASGTEENYR